MIPPDDVLVQTRKRYASAEARITQTIKEIEAGHSALTLDEPSRVIARLERLGANPTQARAIIDGQPVHSVSGLDEISKITIERVLGKDDLTSISFLSRGLRAAKAVARVDIKSTSGRILGYGTGFLISNRLLITNHHVFQDESVAAPSQVRFEYEESVENEINPGVLFNLEPAVLFYANKNLDFAIVAVSSVSQDGQHSLLDYGFLPLLDVPGKHSISEQVNIIQHPSGEKKQLALRENEIVDRDDNFLRYHTDTLPGSSGSPVLNDDWEVVALHHSGVPKLDAAGNILKRDGSIYQKGEDETLIDWISNEGVRASQIVKTLRGNQFPPNQKALIEAVINPEMLHVEKVDQINIDQPNQGFLHHDGNAKWIIPLEVSVKIGMPNLNINQVAVKQVILTPSKGLAQPVVPAVGSDELRDALATFERSRSSQYYNQEQDRRDREGYYAGLDRDASPDQLYQALHQLLEQTHTTRPKYKPMVELYPLIDLHPNGKIQSLYSAQLFEPVEFIRAEFEKLALFEMREKTLQSHNARDEEFDLLEANLAFNCEHVVPQSWFAKQEPMRGDLHHLFACESGCNSFRSNTPYEEFLDFRESIRGQCGKSQGGGFEPESSQGKGAAARATLYFLVRYPGLINANRNEYTPEKIQTLLLWHAANDVNEYELHRNQATFVRQGNRNPFIDFPELAQTVDFQQGLGV
jgi:endonuclease G, mitochondrial